jgi:hypothetical protein
VHLALGDSAEKSTGGPRLGLARAAGAGSRWMRSVSIPLLSSPAMDSRVRRRAGTTDGLLSDGHQFWRAPGRGVRVWIPREACLSCGRAAPDKTGAGVRRRASCTRTRSGRRRVTSGGRRGRWVSSGGFLPRVAGTAGPGTTPGEKGDTGPVHSCSPGAGRATTTSNQVLRDLRPIPESQAVGSAGP